MKLDLISTFPTPLLLLLFFIGFEFNIGKS